MFSDPAKLLLSISNYTLKKNKVHLIFLVIILPEPPSPIYLKSEHTHIV